MPKNSREKNDEIPTPVVLYYVNFSFTVLVNVVRRMLLLS